MVSIVGRGPELAQLERLLDRAACGDGCVVALAGEAGMGKSRLAQAGLDRARARGFVVLSGVACPYQGDLAYAPVLEALRPLVGRERDGGGLLRGLTDLGRIFDGLPLPPPAMVGDPGLERTRLFEAIAELVRRAAHRSPVVLLLDDLHWADGSSLDVLHYLGRAVSGHPCLLLTTYRPGEVGESLRATLASLRRGGRLEEQVVAPLNGADVGGMVADMLGGTPPAPLLDVLQARAAGVPLFVTALVSGLIDDGSLRRSGGEWVLAPHVPDRVPADVRDVVQTRLDRLSGAERSLVDVIAVCGDAATADVLVEVVGHNRDLASALGALTRAGLVTAEPAGENVVYRVSHPLVSEVAYEALPELSRRTYHAALVDVMSRTSPLDPTRIAHHVNRAAGVIDPPRALNLLVMAVDQALERGGGPEAISQARAALALAGRTGRDDLISGLLERSARAASSAGLLQEAVEYWAQACSSYAGDRQALARCLRHQARAEMDLGRTAAALERLERADAALGRDGDDGERAEMMLTRLIAYNRTEQPTGIENTLRELDDLAARTDSDRARLLAQLARVLFGWRVGDAPPTPHAAPELDDVACRIADQALVAWMLRTSVVVAIARGEHVKVARLGQQTLHLLRDEPPDMRAFPTLAIGLAAFQKGAWSEALNALGEGLVLAHQAAVPRFIALALAFRAWVFAHRGDLAHAQACITEFRTAYGSSDERAREMADAAEAVMALARDEPGHATELLAAASHFVVPTWTRRVQGEAYLAAGDAQAAVAVADTLDAFGFPFATATATRLRGLAADDPADRLQLLEQAAEVFESLGLPFETATCRLESAEQQAVGDPDLARRAADRAAEIFEHLGAAPSLERARCLLRAVGAPTRRRRAASGPLSRREIEVAALVADGLSNAAIAQRLFLSKRTVTTHLEHIYRRLGINSREALTRHVRELPDTYTAARDT